MQRDYKSHNRFLSKEHFFFVFTWFLIEKKTDQQYWFYKIIIFLGSLWPSPHSELCRPAVADNQIHSGVDEVSFDSPQREFSRTIRQAWLFWRVNSFFFTSIMTVKNSIMTTLKQPINSLLFLSYTNCHPTPLSTFTTDSTLQ